MLGPSWGGGGLCRAGGRKTSKQPSWAEPPWALGAFPKSPHFSCFQEPSMGRVWHRLNLGSSFREKRNQRSPEGSFIHVRSIY